MIYKVPHLVALTLSVFLLGSVAVQSIPFRSYADDLAEEEESPVAIKAKYRGILLSIQVKNSYSENGVYGLELYLTENDMRKARKPLGWTAEADENSVLYMTEGNPVLGERGKTFRLILTERYPAPTAFEWVALDKEGEELGSGTWYYGGLPEELPTIPVEPTEPVKPVLSVFSDKDVYKSGELLTLYGRGADPTDEVAIKVYNVRGEGVLHTEVKANEDGSYKASIELDVREGKYNAEASQHSNSAATRFLVMSGEPYDVVPPMRMIKVWTEMHEYQQGDTVVIYGQGIPDAKTKLGVYNREGRNVFEHEFASNSDGSFKEAYTLGEDALAGGYKVLAEQFHEELTYHGATWFAMMEGSNVPPVSLAVETHAEKYEAGSKVLITVKTSSPGYVTVAIFTPNGRVLYKEEIKSDESGMATVDYALGADAPGGEWKVLAFQGSAEVRTIFHVLV